MIKSGISTACLYPELLEESLSKILNAGIKNTEIFVNTHSEVTSEFTDMMKSILKNSNAVCTAYHPFTCPIEPMMLFSGYERRVTDFLDYHKYYFEAMNKLETEIFILHGNMNVIAVPEDFYFENFLRLSETAREFGITVAQENVARCQSRSLDFLKSMSEKLKDNARFVLDIKQAVRSGEDPMTMADVLGNKIIHVHMSDHNAENDCLLPGKGSFNIKEFLTKLKKKGFEGSVMTEVYRSSFTDINELIESQRYIENIIQTIQ